MNYKNKIAALGVILLSASGVGYAAAPANSVITNTASLTYTGLGAPLTASVNVSIGLVTSAPTINNPSDNTVAENASSSFAYTITSTANGPDQYNLGRSDVVVDVTGPDASNFTQVGSITSVTLGATALAATATATTTLTVPHDDNTADTSINGIAVGDTVIIDGNTRTVTAINQAGANSTITINTAVTAAQGVGVFEQQTFNLVIADVNTVTAPATSGTITTTVTITSNTTGAFTPALNDVVVTTVNANIPTVTFFKYVRNVTTGAAGTGTPVAIDPDGVDALPSQTYYPTGATAAGNVPAVPGNVLEYVMQANATGTGSVTGASITDTIPTFTTYVANSTSLNGSTVADVGPNSALLGGLTINTFVAATGAGAGSHAAGTLTGATAPGNNAFVIFRVTVQ